MIVDWNNRPRLLTTDLVVDLRGRFFLFLVERRRSDVSVNTGANLWRRPRSDESRPGRCRRIAKFGSVGRPDTSAAAGKGARRGLSEGWLDNETGGRGTVTDCHTLPKTCHDLPKTCHRLPSPATTCQSLSVCRDEIIGAGGDRRRRRYRRDGDDAPTGLQVRARRAGSQHRAGGSKIRGWTHWRPVTVCHIEL